MSEQLSYLPDRGNLIGRYDGSRLLFLPGGAWQVPVIKLARAMGFFVICADGTPHAPGFAAADEGVRVPLQDIDALVEIARSRNVDAVMTEQTDFAVSIVARVADALGLKGLPVDVAIAATNKRIMREQARAAGIRQPEFHVCTTEADVRDAIARFGLPLFCKPVDAQSSRGVGVIDRQDDALIGRTLDRALAASIQKQALVEQQIIGTECTVEGFVVDGHPTTLAISDKEHYADLPGVARTLTWPAAFPRQILDRIAAANDAVVRALKIPFGITHAEFIVDAQGEPWFVETAARGGGSRIPTHIVPAVCGFDPTPALIDTLMEHAPEVRTPFHRSCQLRFLRFPTGKTIRGFPNLAELRARPGVLDLHLNYQPGETIGQVDDDRSRHGFVIAAGENRREAVSLADLVEVELVVEWE